MELRKKSREPVGELCESKNAQEKHTKYSRDGLYLDLLLPLKYAAIDLSRFFLPPL